jgi:hypothetical protein
MNYLAPSVVLVSVAFLRRFRDLSSPRPTPAGVVKFRSEPAFDHAESAANSVIPGNFGLNLLYDSLSSKLYR